MQGDGCLQPRIIVHSRVAVFCTFTFYRVAAYHTLNSLHLYDIWRRLNNFVVNNQIGIFRDNWVTTLADDALTPYHSRSSETFVLAMYENRPSSTREELIHYKGHLNVEELKWLYISFNVWGINKERMKPFSNYRPFVSVIHCSALDSLMKVPVCGECYNIWTSWCFTTSQVLSLVLVINRF